MVKLYSEAATVSFLAISDASTPATAFSNSTRAL
jgi:hypothetical protein